MKIVNWFVAFLFVAVGLHAQFGNSKYGCKWVYPQTAEAASTLQAITLTCTFPPKWLTPNDQVFTYDTYTVKKADEKFAKLDTDLNTAITTLQTGFAKALNDDLLKKITTEEIKTFIQEAVDAAVEDREKQIRELERRIARLESGGPPNRPAGGR